MRYFVEVTAQEAISFEADGKAKVVSGASGNSARPGFYGPDVSWLLMRTVDADKEYRAEVYGEVNDSV